MPEEPEIRQQTNSQTQAGAAAQLIVNIFMVSTADGTLLVKPIAFHMDGATNRPLQAPGGPVAGPAGVPSVDLQMDAKKRSNAQGQGLTVTNEVDYQEVLGRALLAASTDPDIQKALGTGGD